MRAPIQPATPVVALHDVTIQYGHRQALRRATVTFRHGGTGLLGVNGAGKSTLLLGILGQLRPSAGRIEVLGRDVLADPLYARSRIGYVPERDAYIPDLTAIAYVAYCGELAGLPDDEAIGRAHDVLWYVGLGESRYRAVETFSTGMRQRLKLAQALVHDPDILLLDEPTDGMDPKGRHQMLDLIRDLSHRRGLDVIFSSHVLGDIERTCDSVVVLHEGRIVRAGAIDEWRNAAASRVYEVQIKGDRSAFRAALDSMRVECGAEDGQTLTLATSDGQPRAIFVAACQAGVQIRHLRPKLPSLEELFERATGSSETTGAARSCHVPHEV